jgi:hypothetical protein
MHLIHTLNRRQVSKEGIEVGVIARCAINAKDRALVLRENLPRAHDLCCDVVSHGWY